EVIESDLVERRGRSEGRDVAANAFLRFVRADDHRRRIPSNEALDATLNVRTARHEHLFFGRNRVDVGCVGGERQLDAVLSAVDGQFPEQTRQFARSAALQHIIERVEPFPRFDGVELCGILRRNVSHGSYPFGIVGLRATRAPGQFLIVQPCRNHAYRSPAPLLPAHPFRFRHAIVRARRSIVRASGSYRASAARACAATVGASPWRNAAPFATRPTGRARFPGLAIRARDCSSSDWRLPRTAPTAPDAFLPATAQAGRETS